MSRAQGKHQPLPGVKPPEPVAADRSGIESSPARRREWPWLALLLVLGLAPRLLMVSVFPTLPQSDFGALIAFALALRDVSLIPRGWFWDFFNSGLPLVLSLLFRVIPAHPHDVARVATAAVCGLVPLLPFAVWRGITPFGVRLAAGIALALWPGQILFSGVVAQDNWVLLPLVALACLAVRSLLAPGRERPVLAGLSYAAAVAVRQEMLVVLLPLLLAAAGIGAPEAGRRRWRRLAAAALAAAIPLLLLATQRQLATGRFALTSAHGGLALLGAYIPGATANSWTDPSPYVATVEPELLRDIPRLHGEAARLALAEALRRPGFHAARIASGTILHALGGEIASLYWSLTSPESLPPDRAAPAQEVARIASPILRFELGAILALFLASVFLALRWRHRAILVLAAAVLLKVAIHAVVVNQGRYFLAVTALQLLVLPLAAWEAARRRQLEPALVAAGTAAVAVFVLAAAAEHTMARVRELDVVGQRVFRFVLTAPGGGSLSCRVAEGALTAVDTLTASLETLSPNPKAGDEATAECELLGRGNPGPLVLQVFDAYAPGGSPGRMRQRVLVDGTVALDHDIAREPGTGWLDAPVGRVADGARKKILVQVVAGTHDPAVFWGRAANTRFRLERAREEP